MTGSPTVRGKPDTRSSHRRRTRATAPALVSIRSSLRDAFAESVAAAGWLTAADSLGLAIARQAIERMEPAPPAAPDGAMFPDVPAVPPAVPVADWLRLADLVLDLVGPLGLTAKGRHAIGLEVTPPAAPAPAPAERRKRTRARVDYG